MILRRLPVSELKLDRSFVADLEHDEAARALSSAILGIGKSLHLTVVAEGVENIRDLHALGRIGCHYVQGFLYGKPMKAADVLGFYREESDIRRSAESADYQVE